MSVYLSRTVSIYRSVIVCLLVLGLFVGWAVLIGADFYVVPVKGQFTSWDKKISGAARFTLVLDGEAVLDRETGLVWQKSPCHVSMNPDFCKRDWLDACNYCCEIEVGGRKGWRLPSIEELASLIDMDGDGAGRKLPNGHPFTNLYSNEYWSLTTYVGNTDGARFVDIGNGDVNRGSKVSSNFKKYMWCVRGGQGYDAY